MMTRYGLMRVFVAGVLFSCGAAYAQQKTPTKLSFEVATIKPSALNVAKIMADVRSGKMPALGPRIDGALATYNYVTLQQLVVLAYKVKPFQIVGPAWLTKEHFDIQAKLPDGASKDDAPKMLQTLLEDRFKLVAHQDEKKGPVFALVVGKDGPKLQESPPDEAPVDMNAPLKPGETRMNLPNGSVDAKQNADGTVTTRMNMGKRGSMTMQMNMQARTMTLQASKMTMARLADELTTLLRTGGGKGRQVVDMTGLKGNYQVSLTISMASLMAMARAQGAAVPGGSTAGQNWGSSPGAAASEPSGDGATIFESVKKLGLALDPRTAKVEELVIDHIEKTPTAN